MIKVLHLIHGLATGGAETLVKEYALHLDKTRFDLVVLCFYRCNSPYEALLERSGVRVEYISDQMRFWSRHGFFAKACNHFQLRFLVRKVIRREKPDVLHFHLPVGHFVRLSRPTQRTRLFFTQHFAVDSWKKKYPQDIRDLKWLIHHYQTQLIAINPEMAQEMNRLFSVQNTLVLNNGIDMSRYRVRVDKEAKRKELGVPEKGFVVVHVGRFTAVKNHDFLVDVFQALYEKRPDAFLLMVGAGPEERVTVKKLEEAGLSSHYKILHNRTDVPEILLSCDGAIFPSLSEGLGIAAVEMQAAGLPCVVSARVPQTTRISDRIHYRELSDPPEAWANDLLALAGQKAQADLFGADEWDIVKIIEKLETLYEEGVGQSCGEKSD